MPVDCRVLMVCCLSPVALASTVVGANRLPECKLPGDAGADRADVGNDGIQVGADGIAGSCSRGGHQQAALFRRLLGPPIAGRHWNRLAWLFRACRQLTLGLFRRRRSAATVATMTTKRQWQSPGWSTASWGCA